jgi:hypothetical protein
VDAARSTTLPMSAEFSGVLAERITISAAAGDEVLRTTWARAASARIAAR